MSLLSLSNLPRDAATVNVSYDFTFRDFEKISYNTGCTIGSESNEGNPNFLSNRIHFVANLFGKATCRINLVREMEPCMQS